MSAQWWAKWTNEVSSLAIPARREFACEESVHSLEDFPRRLRRCHLPPQLGSLANSMREPARELLHLSDRVGPSRIAQVAEISGEQPVSVVIVRLVISTRRGKLFNLAKDPWIGAGPASDHHRVASGFRPHS